MDVDKRKLHITQLLLDSENPRHDPIKNQAEIIKELIVSEKIENLAKDIADKGSLSPLDTVGVMETDNEDYIVIEGNRRVCACMILNNPSLCPDKPTQEKIMKITKNGSVPVELECVIFEDRESADHWIKLRHEGQQNGVGTREWNSKQQARYSQKMGRKNQNAQSLELLNYAVDSGIIDENEREKIAITTLQRYLGSPVVRNLFGLQNNQDLSSRHDEDTFNALIHQFMADIESGAAHSRTDKNERIEYANTLQKTIAGPPSPDNEITNFGKKNEASPPKSGSKKNVKRAKKDPANRIYLPGGSVFSISDKLLNRVYHELKRTPIEKHELSTAYLFRAFIERLSVLYLKKHEPGKMGGESKLQPKLKWVSESLEKKHSIASKKLNTINMAAGSKTSKLSPMFFGMMVHLSHLPTKRELNQMWDSWEETLHLIHDHIEK